MQKLTVDAKPDIFPDTGVPTRTLGTAGSARCAVPSHARGPSSSRTALPVTANRDVLAHCGMNSTACAAELFLQRVLGVVQPPGVRRTAGVGRGRTAVTLEDLVVADRRPGEGELRGVAGPADAVLHLAEIALQLLDVLGALLRVNLRHAL